MVIGLILILIATIQGCPELNKVEQPGVVLLLVNKRTQAIFAIFMMQMSVVGRNLHIYSAGTTHGMQSTVLGQNLHYKAYYII